MGLGGLAPALDTTYALLDNFITVFDNSQHTKSVYVTTSTPQCVCVLYKQYQK